MIHSARILKTLDFLDQEYVAHLGSSDYHRPVMFSKLAVLEYCGWIEYALDEIARNSVRRRLKTKKSRKFLEDRISATHGFVYKQKFRPLLGYAVGTERLNRVEHEMKKSGELLILSSKLASINRQRQVAAHTFTIGQTQNFDAPSTIKQELQLLEPILQKLWKLVSEIS